MKTWPKILALLLVLSCVLANARAATNQTVDAAIQAIQQAPDPSAVVAAYANGFALDRNNSRLYEAYVSRMVDLGLPEMAYHQAQTLTTLQANNGLAWGVVAYVDARRARMPEAISVINLAGQFAPDNKFVQHTAGELVAWYDLKADKANIPDNAKVGLTKVRSLLDKRPAFAEAYSTAQKAYQTPTSATSQMGQAVPNQAAPVQAALDQVAPSVPNAPQVPVAPQAQADQVAPLGYAAPAPAPAYYQDYSSSYYSPDYSGAYLDWGPDYFYDSGPGWVAPTPWCWWQPCGFWGGCDFFPFGVSFAFGGFDDFHHFHHDGFFDHDGRFGHGDRFGHDGVFGHNGAFGHGQDPALWHRDPQGRNNFFGTPARPSASAAQWARAGSPARSSSATPAASTGTRWWSGAGQRSSLATAGASAGSAQPSMFANRWSTVGSSGSSARIGGLPATRGNWNAAHSTTTQSSMLTRSPTPTAPSVRSWTGSSTAYRVAPATRGTWAGQNYYARGYMAPRAVAPGASSFGGYRTAPTPRSSWATPSYRAPAYAAPRSFGGSLGSFRGGNSFGTGFHGGGFSGGGFHGGGFGAGGHGGGGHR